MMPLFHGKMSQSATARPARPVPPVLHRTPDPQDRAVDLGWTGRHFLLLGPFADLQDELCNWIVDVGAQASMTGAILPSVHWVARRADKFDAVLLDADHIGAVESLVETGFDLRRAAPQLPIVILSSQVSCHDFSRERQAICDATLRRPLSRSAFFLGVSAAQSNRADAQMSRTQA
jgi:hypothetical protein